MTEFDDIRLEHAEQVIGLQIAELLARVVDATAPIYPPSEYSTAGVWDRAALDDALQDWTLVRLLERGDLAVIVASARSVGALRAILTRSFAQHLTNRRRRTSATNLFGRTTAMLRSEDTFLPVGSTRRVGEQAWTLSSDPASSPATPGTVATLIKAAASRGDSELGVVRYGPYSLKSSPILRHPELRGFLTFVLAEADGFLTAAEIFEVMRHRFNLVELPPADLDDTLTDRQPPVPVTVENRMLAQSVLARLGHNAARLIRALADADDDPMAAARLASASLAAVTHAMDKLHALIAEYAESADDAVAVHRHVIESLYGEGETR